MPNNPKYNKQGINAYFVKGRRLRCETWPFTLQNTADCNVKDGLLQSGRHKGNNSTTRKGYRIIKKLSDFTVTMSQPPITRWRTTSYSVTTNITHRHALPHRDASIRRL